MPRILSYIYSEGPGATSGVACPATARFDVGITLGVIEQASPSLTTRARLTAPTRFDDALVAWQNSLNMPAPAGAPSGLYTLTYDPTTARVTLATTNGVAFQPVYGSTDFLGELWNAGFGLYHTSFTGKNPPFGAIELLGVTIRPSQDAARVTLEDFRHGRSAATVWGNAATYEVRAWFRRDASWSYALTGRIRIKQGDGGAYDSAYAPDNLGGYLDGYVVQTSDLKGFGPNDEWLSVDILVAVTR